MCMKKITEQADLLELKQQIVKMETPIPGSIQTAYLRCGKKNCKCQQSEEDRHGPYYLWYRRINGKLKTQSIAEEDVSKYRMWINNREKLESTVQKMISIGADFAAAKKSPQNKLKTNSDSKRGK